MNDQDLTDAAAARAHLERVRAELKVILPPLDSLYWKEQARTALYRMGGVYKEHVIAAKAEPWHCFACKIEADIGSEENPHPIPGKYHTCKAP